MGGWDFIENKFDGRWRIFGESPCGRWVDIADNENSTLASHVERAYAEALIKRHNGVLDCLTEMALAFSNANEDAFHKFWWKE